MGVLTRSTRFFSAALVTSVRAANPAGAAVVGGAATAGTVTDAARSAPERPAAQTDVADGMQIAFLEGLPEQCGRDGRL
ncbi:hypothetical protein Aau02nite_73250 [Amorphoplanes auranticolor]|uniref:Secreted protein n=1 Tax=Actinoplanes auranticolor TaxID=47988 RepID=A0A919VVQ6_9ACTN|nr:hypothetical protein Aau02nite_73250 [Actinoplanes auranticolor]